MGQYDELMRGREFDQNPYPVYHLLRSECPVYWNDAWRCWVLTRYSDVLAVLQDHQRFSSLGRMTSVLQRELSPAFLGEVRPLLDHYAGGLINVDPPDHTRMRALVHKAFTPRVLEKLRPRIQAIVDELLDEVQPAGRMDLVRNLAFPLPATVIAELMGVPQSERERFKEWSGRILEFQATPRPEPEVLLRSQEALLALRELFRDLSAQRLHHPQDDLVTALATVEQEGDRLTEQELLSTCVSILIGGHETTTSLITTGTMLLLRHPDLMQKLRENPGLMSAAVEEFLRYEPPFQRNRRNATEDIRMDGQTIKKGDAVMLLLGAANRDPAQFDEPDELMIDRHPNRHVAFGYGVHFCLGAPLARIEAPIALNTILQRLLDLELADDNLEWSNGLMRGLKALHVRFRA